MIGSAAGYAVVTAIAGVGLETRLTVLNGPGIKLFCVGLIAFLVVGVASAIAVIFLGGFVKV